MKRRYSILPVLAFLFAACASSAVGSPSPSASAVPPGATPTAQPSTPATVEPSGAPSAAPSAATTIVLHVAAANMACDAIGVPYRSVTFRIDPSATEQVTAVTDAGKSLVTHWSAGFVPGTDAEKVIRDAKGQVVASDGEVLPIPDGAWPRLHGYFVCPSPDALYVLITEPS